ETRRPHNPDPQQGLADLDHYMPRLQLSADVFRPLTAWVYGERFFMKEFEYYEYDTHVPKRMFAGLDAFFEVHEAPQTPLKTLEQSWTETKAYVADACRIVGRDRPGFSLSQEERQKVLLALGEPPGPAWPLYFFTVGDQA